MIFFYVSDDLDRLKLIVSSIRSVQEISVIYLKNNWMYHLQKLNVCNPWSEKIQMDDMRATVLFVIKSVWREKKIELVLN